VAERAAHENEWNRQPTNRSSRPADIESASERSPCTG
jgi:hypothetical protein